MISGQQPQPPALTETISGMSKVYQSSGLCSGLLFVFGDMVFVIILIDFSIFSVSSFFFFKLLIDKNVMLIF